MREKSIEREKQEDVEGGSLAKNKTRSVFSNIIREPGNIKVVYGAVR